MLNRLSENVLLSHAFNTMFYNIGMEIDVKL